MAANKNAYYKRYNGTDWDVIYFYTLAGNVGETASRWFMKPANTVNGKAFTKDGGVTLDTDDIGLGGDASVSATFNELTFSLEECGNLSEALVTAWNAMYNLEAELQSADAALGTRVKKIEDAYSDGTIITTSNMGSKITKVGTVASGTWNGAAIDDAHIASATKWNAKQDKLTFDSAPTADSTKPVTSGGVYSAIKTVTEIAQGKTNTYVIKASGMDDSTYLNKKFNVLQTATLGMVQIDLSSDSAEISDNASKIVDVNGVGTKISSMKIGDIVLTQEFTVKDFYLGSIADGVCTFYEIDSDKPDLTAYAKTSAVASAISDAIGALDSSKDAGAGKYLQSITITDGKITGGTVGAIPTSLPASDVTDTYSSTGTAPVSGKAVNAALSQSLSKSGTGNGITVKLTGTIQSPTVGVSVVSGVVGANVTAVVSGGNVYNYVSARATKVYYADSVPTSGMIAGDICIEY